ncbi:MAG: hypothetical protein HC913_01335 [Microscillaceae bacterium]|nr:hypothetical protein [Microscillaceae bacterium]
MNLHNFEEMIFPHILDRGWDYYEEERIEKIEQLDPGLFWAEVMGRTLYDVHVQLIGSEIISLDCNCPYADGKICKHEVAVLYYIRDAEWWKEGPASSLTMQAVQWMAKMERPALEAFLLEMLRKHAVVRDAFWERQGD